MTTATSTRSRLDCAALARGGVAGMVAGGAMAMYAMVASVTYQHHGFFTPLFHISALFGSPDAMMRSMNEAMTGDRFWFSAGPAALGLVIHMLTGMAFGMMFTAITRRLRGTAIAAVGVVYGLALFVVSAFVALPLAAKITGTGDTISDMASMVGYATFAVEHMMFGAVLGLLTLRTTPVGRPTATAVDARSTMLAR